MSGHTLFGLESVQVVASTAREELQFKVKGQDARGRAFALRLWLTRVTSLQRMP